MIPFQTTLEKHLTLLLDRPGGDWTRAIKPSIAFPYAVIDKATASEIRATIGYNELCHLEPVEGQETVRLFWRADWLDYYANQIERKRVEAIKRVVECECSEAIAKLTTKYMQNGMSAQSAKDMATMVIMDKV